MTPKVIASVATKPAPNRCSAVSWQCNLRIAFGMRGTAPKPQRAISLYFKITDHGRVLTLDLVQYMTEKCCLYSSPR
jgi:hypothetical protein